MTPRLPPTQVVTDRTITQNMQCHVPAQVFLNFDALARKRALAKSVLLRRIVEAIVVQPSLIDKIIGRRGRP